jgi:hypothetical protein
VSKIAADLASATALNDKKENIMMRKQLLGLATFVAFITLAVGSMQAQTGYQIQTNIPFDFTAGKTSLRAGTYAVVMISENTLLVRSIDGEKSVLLLARQAESEGKQKLARLIFNRYGDRYFLWQAWVTGGDVGRELYPSGAERRLAKELSLAKGDAKSQKVQVAVR